MGSEMKGSVGLGSAGENVGTGSWRYTVEPKPMRGKLLLLVDPNQKDDFQMELGNSGIKIWTTRKFGTDGKVTNPAIAKVYAVGAGIDDVFVGDYVLCHHNAFKRGEYYQLGDTGLVRDGLMVFAIEYSWVCLRIDEQGEVLPIKSNLVIERIPVVVDTTLEVPDTAARNESNVFRVLKAGKDCEGIKEGDEIVCYKCSDYEMNYTLDYKERQVIRVEYRDVLAIRG